MDIIPPKPQPRRDPFGLAVAQGKVIELELKIGDLRGKLDESEIYRKIWKALFYCLLGYIIFR